MLIEGASVNLHRANPPKNARVATTSDRRRFFGSFIYAAKRGGPFGCALTAQTDPRGVIIFDYRNKQIPYPVAYHVNRQVLLVPEKTAGRIEVRDAFCRIGGGREKVWFDAEAELFFREREGNRIYFVVLQGKENFLEAEVAGYTLCFGSKKRKAGEVVQVKIEGGKLANIEVFSEGGTPLKWEFIDGKGGKKIVIVGGNDIPVNIKKALGAIPITKILSSRYKGRTRHFVYFGGNRNFWLKEETLKRYHLSAGDTLEAAQLGDKLCSLIDRRGKKPVYIPLILNWRWDGERFVLDHTTSSDVAAERLAGCRVLEQTETAPLKSGDCLMAGGIKKIIVGYVPWKTKPAPLSVLVADGKEVLFFRDSARFSSKDWEVARLVASPKAGDPVRALAKAEEAKALEKTAKEDILEVAGLERACDAYVDAFCLDPSNRGYLAAAKELRSFIIVRERHLARRPLYYKWLNENLNSAQSEDEQLSLLSDFIKGAEHNPTSVAYVLEIIAGLAEGNYPGERELFRRVFLLLPRIIDFKEQSPLRLLRALRMLLGDPGLAYVTHWTLSHPPAGREAIFLRRKTRKFGIPAEAICELNWEGQKSRQVLSFKGARIIAREVFETANAHLGLINFVANQYQGRGLDFEDLVREGYFGLLRAVELFKPEKNVKFSTYAVIWIKQTIGRAIMNKGRTIRIDTRTHAILGKTVKAEKALRQELRREPTEEEIVARVEIPIERLREIKIITRHTKSLSEPVGVDDDGAQRQDFIADSAAPDPEAVIAEKLSRMRISAAVSALPLRLRVIIENRFGLNGKRGETKSFEEIGRLCSPPISKRRAQQLAVKALSILRKRAPELREILAA